MTQKKLNLLLLLFAAIFTSCGDSGDDQQKLANLALNSSDAHVRHVAMKKIEDPKIIKELAQKIPICSEAAEKIKDKEFLKYLLFDKKQPSEVKSHALYALKDQELIKRFVLDLSDKDGIRDRAIDYLEDQDILAEISQNDKNFYARENAINHLKDEKVLQSLAFNDPNPKIRSRAASELNDQEALKKIILNDPSDEVKSSAIFNIKIYDEKMMIEFALKSKNTDLREKATEKIKDQLILREIALNDSHERIKIAAVKNIINENILDEISQSKLSPSVRAHAIRKITNTDLLKNISSGDRDPEIMTLAKMRLGEISMDPFSFLSRHPCFSIMIISILIYFVIKYLSRMEIYCLGDRVINVMRIFILSQKLFSIIQISAVSILFFLAIFKIDTRAGFQSIYLIGIYVGFPLILSLSSVASFIAIKFIKKMKTLAHFLVFSNCTLLTLFGFNSFSIISNWNQLNMLGTFRVGLHNSELWMWIAGFTTSGATLYYLISCIILANKDNCDHLTSKESDSCRSDEESP